MGLTGKLAITKIMRWLNENRVVASVVSQGVRAIKRGTCIGWESLTEQGATEIRACEAYTRDTADERAYITALE
jgi:hypothetical protein